MEPSRKSLAIAAVAGRVSLQRRARRVIYVGKAKNLRARVRNYFSDERLADAKTGTLMADARDIEYILVDNNKEALALENHLIKQWKPRFNILLRDDKTYPYIKLTNEKYPRVYVTRRLIKDGSTYYGPYFPGQPGASAGQLHPSPLQDSILQGGFHAHAHASLPGVSYPSLPGAVRGRADYRRSNTPRPCAMCGCSWKAA